MSDRPIWDDGTAPPHPALAGEIDCDVCVVGLGASGLSAARELLALGQRVVAIDAGRIGGGAAGRNGGFLLAGAADFHHDAVAAHGAERMVALYRRTLEELARVERDTPGVMRRTGSLRIAVDGEELDDCEQQFAMMQRDGLMVERYAGPEGKGLLFPQDAAFNPMLRCRALARLAAGEGAMLFEQSAAIAIGPGHVGTTGGEIRARQVIVAVDGRLELLLPEVAGRVRSARLQMLATAPAAPGIAPRPVYYRWGYEYWQQLPDGRIALGGFRDQGGEAEWSTEAVVTPAIQERLERLLHDRIAPGVPVERRWSGVVGYTPDGLPLIDEVRPGVWALGGYNGTGNLIGTLAGRGVAQLVVRGESPLLAELIAERPAA